MTPAELAQALKAGQIKAVKPEIPSTPQTLQIPDPKPDISEFLIVLSALRLIKKHLTTAPTSTPKNFLDQIQFYDDGTNRRVYFYVNKTWHFATLT